VGLVFSCVYMIRPRSYFGLPTSECYSVVNASVAEDVVCTKFHKNVSNVATVEAIPKLKLSHYTP
jgi:hypothetical protein